MEPVLEGRGQGLSGEACHAPAAHPLSFAHFSAVPPRLVVRGLVSCPVVAIVAVTAAVVRGKHDPKVFRKGQSSKVKFKRSQKFRGQPGFQILQERER